MTRDEIAVRWEGKRASKRLKAFARFLISTRLDWADILYIGATSEDNEGPIHQALFLFEDRRASDAHQTHDSACQSVGLQDGKENHMTKMTNTIWKIRDTVTGKFWSGYRNGCNHAIGTRFDRRSSLDGTIQRLINSTEMGFPKTWEVLTVEIHETVIDTMSGHSTWIDLNIDQLHGIIIDRGVQLDNKAQWGVTLFRTLRRNGEMTTWPFMGLRAGESANSWNKFKAHMKPLGIDNSRMKRHDGGWAVFADKEAVTAAKLSGTMHQVFEVNELRIALARKLGVPTESI